ncbi:hypothetical protein B005_4043 [Nocardiopsis alba ATCC BAA-2165]|uniref:Uncharacterized protein n=1 Tax=Nocardiopsis alba (strain ATCC BAA-2165 / BE74) TaxID=1205910 RepID=J7L1M8_NOCAA|nr:hypothetical protein B005_4043 [Nocardiopsis alba ATCC BAA-2165]
MYSSVQGSGRVENDRTQDVRSGARGLRRLCSTGGISESGSAPWVASSRALAVWWLLEIEMPSSL